MIQYFLLHVLARSTPIFSEMTPIFKTWHIFSYKIPYVTVTSQPCSDVKCSKILCMQLKFLLLIQNYVFGSVLPRWVKPHWRVFTVSALSGITQKYTLQQLSKWHLSFFWGGGGGGASRFPCEAPLKLLPLSVLLCSRRSGETLKNDMAEFHQKNVEAAQFLLRSDNRKETLFLHLLTLIKSYRTGKI